PAQGVVPGAALQRVVALAARERRWRRRGVLDAVSFVVGTHGDPDDALGGAGRRVAGHGAARPGGDLGARVRESVARPRYRDREVVGLPGIGGIEDSLDIDARRRGAGPG